MATSLKDQRAQSLKAPSHKRPADSEPSAMEPRSAKQSCPGKVTAAHSPFSLFDRPTGRLEDHFALSADAIGAGEYGTVRRCTHLATGRVFACKSIRKDGLVTARAQEEVRREVALMRRVAGHPGVVQLRGAFEDDRCLRLVMDLCDGGELFDEIVRRERIPEGEAAALFRQLASAVAHCHARGVLHRDLKPENILLARNAPAATAAATPAERDTSAAAAPCAAAAPGAFSARIADFGLSIPLRAGERGYGTAGSPFYMAPEVLTGEYEFGADVWSLGVILYIMLSGRPPFWGADDNEVYDAVLEGRLDFAGPTWEGVSAEAKGLIRCMLQSDARRRPTAAKVLSHPWVLAQGGARKSAVQSTAHFAGVPMETVLATC
eukprot:TRINITY_DN2986_c1_g1_i1.p2 TRINITY_DN2986_c1_g1~~TRINITY_DN2986_c1_g1_i1.p2  ORF type:complete len:378 (+),score=-13.41 TRINITY_DN2986_c1_g1_i1:140-1273(+)